MKLPELQIEKFTEDPKIKIMREVYDIIEINLRNLEAIQVEPGSY